MSASSTTPSARAIQRTLFVGLIGVHAWRVLEIAPKWVGGAPPAYPGQYESRLFNAIVGIGIIGAVLVDISAKRRTLGGRLAYWGLLGAALVVLVGLIITDR